MINTLRKIRLRRSYRSGVFFGVLYGIALRVLVGPNKLNMNSQNVTWAMTLAFILLGPIIIGFITINEAEQKSQRSIAFWIFAPWLPAILTFFIAVLFRIEGAICLVFALPIVLVGATIGGIAAGIQGRRRRSTNTMTLSCLALLPALLAPAEARLSPPISIHTVHTEIRIHASPDTVWRNIERVTPISSSELHSTWAQSIGFPRPVEATLSYEGIGGVRHATFERGLTFIETVTAWEPNQRLSFSIKADTAHIPPTTLDEHVTIGGPYFDVLNGEYRLEQLANGEVLLHLTSHQRLSTDFNGYAGLWTDAVMQNLQTSILEVIQHRCEHA